MVMNIRAIGKTVKEYEGNWENDKRHGWGTQTYDNGDSYRGNWENDKRVF